MLIGDFNAKLEHDTEIVKQGKNDNSIYLKNLMLKFNLIDNFENYLLN